MVDSGNQRPENDNGRVEESRVDDGEERVRSAGVRTTPQPTSLGVREQHSSEIRSTGIVPGGIRPMEVGTVSRLETPFPPKGCISAEKNISHSSPDFEPSDFNLTLQKLGPPYSTPLILNQAQTPSPSSAHILDQISPYFVTEPNDSPKSSSPNLNHSPFSPNPSLTHIEPNSLNPSITFLDPVSPTRNLSTETQPTALTQLITSSLNTLSIKRKSSEDPPENSRSKILRLCSPTPPTQTNPPTSYLKPKNPRANRRGGKGISSIKGDSITPFIVNHLAAVESLNEVCVHHSFPIEGREVEMVPVEVVSLEDSSISMSSTKLGKVQGLVAGPKQPHSQC